MGLGSEEREHSRDMQRVALHLFLGSIVEVGAISASGMPHILLSPWKPSHSCTAVGAVCLAATTVASLHVQSTRDTVDSGQPESLSAAG